MLGIGMKEVGIIVAVIVVFIVLNMMLPARYGRKKDTVKSNEGEIKSE